MKDHLTQDWINRRPGRTPLSTILLCSWAAAIGMACAPKEASVRPGVNREFEGDVRVDEWVERFEGESREVYREREKIVSAMDLRPGLTVADIGAGTGFFSVMFAERVGPTGHVYAVDIAEAFLREIEERAVAARVMSETTPAEIETVLCKPDSVELPTGRVNVAFICDTYHHFEFPRSTMRSLRKAMKPGGVVYVIDFERIEGQSRPWVLEHVRAGQDIIRQEIESAGFRWEPMNPPPDFLEENYMIKFRRAD